MKIVKVKVENLRPNEYNPKFMSEEEEKNLTESIDKFGMVDVLVVNEAENRKNIIIGGHQRYFILKKKGIEETEVSYVNLPNIEDEKELNLRLTKNTGHLDTFKLAKIERDILEKSGWNDKELEKIFKGEDKEKPEVEFTEELKESHNYLVLYFDNEIDWLQLQSIFPLKTVQSLDSKEGFEKKGVGRVVKGSEFLNKVLHENKS